MGFLGVHFEVGGWGGLGGGGGGGGGAKNPPPPPPHLKLIRIMLET